MQRPHLNNREQQVLYWTALGKTCEETGMIMGITRKTVEHYRCRILRRFNCVVMVQAVVVGFYYGYLSAAAFSELYLTK